MARGLSCVKRAADTEGCFDSTRIQGAEPARISQDEYARSVSVPRRSLASAQTSKGIATHLELALKAADLPLQLKDLKQGIF